MPKSKKKHHATDPVAEHHSRVIKGGVYDGSSPSTDFVVSGHSTGSANSEMEALSHQVSIDAGRVPDYPVDDNFRMQKSPETFGEAMPEDDRDTADLGGPELYGPKPDLLQDSPLSPKSKIPTVGLWGSIGLAAAALAGVAAFSYFGRKRASAT